MAKRIPQAFIDDILDKTSLANLIDEHVPLKKQGSSYQACCPFHQEKTPSFYVMPDKGFYHCFGCKQSGNAISFLIDYLSHDFLEAVEILASRLGMTVPRDENIKAFIDKSKPLLELMAEIDGYYQQNLKHATDTIAYLKAREISGETAKHFHLGYAKPGWHHLEEQFKGCGSNLDKTGMRVENDKGNRYDRFRHRLMFPIFDRKGRVIAFGGRVIDKDDKPKYLNSPETALFHKSQELYALNLAQKSEQDSLIVVEGYMDVIGLYQHGIDNAVATLGTSLTASHIERLIATRQQLYVCFDGDSAGRQAAIRALDIAFPMLTDGIDIRFIFLSEGQDPDSLVKTQGRQAFDALLKSAQPLQEVFFARLKQQCDLSQLSGRSLLVAKAKPYLDQLSASSFKDLLMDSLALNARMDKATLVKHLDSGEVVTRTNQSQGNKEKPSMLRLASAILVQQPTLINEINLPDLTELNIPGNELLQALLAVCPEKQNTAQLIEHFRHLEQSPIILKLAQLALNIPSDGLLSELQGALNKLAKLALQQQIEALLGKSQLHGLDESERKSLQQLIRQQKSVPA